MATINSIAFDQPDYAEGAVITATVNFTPDSPSVAPVTHTLTAEVKDAAGNVLATSSSPFVINVAQAGDTVSVSDDASHTWAEGSPAPQADGSVTVEFTTSA